MSTASNDVARPQLRKSDSTAHLFEELEHYSLPAAKRTGKVLGSGAYGTVELLDVNGMLCAGKSIHNTLLEGAAVGVRKIIECFIRECELMSKLRHPQIVQFLGVCFLPPDSRLPVLVMEYMEASLDDVLESTPNFPITLKRSILQDVAQGLSFLHSHNPPVIHRDLTAKNVLLSSNMQAKISDLGVARILDIRPSQLEATLTRIPGTASYMPPEAFSQYTVYNSSIDIFSLGHLMLYTVTQVFPGLIAATFVNDDGQVMARTEVERRGEAMVQLKAQLGETHPFIPLITKCLSNRPKDRPSAKEVLQSLVDMTSVMPDPYARMTRLHLVQQLVKKDEEIQQQQVLLMKSQQERKRLHNIIADLNKRIEELTDGSLERRSSNAASKGLVQEELAMVEVGSDDETDAERSALNPRMSPPDSDEYIFPDTISNTSSYDPADDYIFPLETESLSQSSTRFATSSEHYHDNPDEHAYEPAPDHDPSGPRSRRPKKPFLTYVEMDSNVLFFLRNNSGGRVHGATYNLQRKSVRIECDKMNEVHQSAARFQQVYRHIIKSPEFYAKEITIPAGVDHTWIEHILIYLKEKLQRSAIVHEISRGTIKLVTISKSDYELLKSFLPIALKNLTPIAHVRPPHVPMYVHHMPNERRLMIKNSNIGAEDVHVIVNIATSDLKLRGGLSDWLNNLSLGELQKQCDMYLRHHDNLEMGGVMIVGLPPGARGILKCNWVINAVTPSAVSSEGALKRTLTKVVRDVIWLAESNNAISLAMPPLCMGCVGISRHFVTSVLIGELLTRKNFRSNCLEDIRIVTPDFETYDTLIRYLKAKDPRRATYPSRR